MIARLFARRDRRGPKGSLPEGQRVYAIGDVHGRLDLLDALLHQIEDDARECRERTLILFLGDLIDRGPASAQVVERAMQVRETHPNTRFLAGNHEEVFLKALAGDQKALTMFTRIGGRETILSYGVSEDAYRDADYPELLALLQQRVPAAHVAFLEAFEDLIVLGDYAFVHAGVRPGVPLDQQKPGDLRWIRGEFLTSRAPYDKVIVHGHTITDTVDVNSNRIGIDTGAYASGKLTALGMEGDRTWILDT